MVCTGTRFWSLPSTGCTSFGVESTATCVVYSNRCATVSWTSTLRFMIPSWYTPIVASTSSVSLSHGSIPSYTRTTTIRCHGGWPSSAVCRQYLDHLFLQISRMFCITPYSVRVRSLRSSL